ncbi:hypothetical protein HZC09_06105 [Candidatus Micrarchaeota archaeon]|nr:hypothetical protein [Candidatus Micrarchaeota archaeon]
MRAPAELRREKSTAARYPLIPFFDKFYARVNQMIHEMQQHSFNVARVSHYIAKNMVLREEDYIQLKGDLEKHGLGGHAAANRQQKNRQVYAKGTHVRHNSWNAARHRQTEVQADFHEERAAHT